jgi:hypothetical protein
MQPNPENLFRRLDLTYPLIGFYDAPDPKPFGPLMRLEPGNCVFTFFKEWRDGKTLHITREHDGCGGAGRWESFLLLLPDRCSKGFVRWMSEVFCTSRF